jgi:hypothetical protein
LQLSLPRIVDILIQFSNSWEGTEENECKAQYDYGMIWLHPQQALADSGYISNKFGVGLLKLEFAYLEVERVEFGGEEDAKQ